MHAFSVKNRFPESYGSNKMVPLGELGRYKKLAGWILYQPLNKAKILLIAAAYTTRLFGCSHIYKGSF